MLDIGSKYTSFGISVQLPGVSALEQIYDLSTGMMHKIMQELCGEDWAPSAVNIARRQPDDLKLYRQYFGMKPYFNTTVSSVTFESKWLRQKTPAADELLYRYLEEEARQLHELQSPEVCKFRLDCPVGNDISTAIRAQ